MAEELTVGAETFTAMMGERAEGTVILTVETDTLATGAETLTGRLEAFTETFTVGRTETLTGGTETLAEGAEAFTEMLIGRVEGTVTFVVRLIGRAETLAETLA